MIKIMFVCLGNICRSPMAEFLMKDYVIKMGKEKDFYISSSATSTYEIGSPVHYGTKKILDRLNIDCSKKRAVQLTKNDYDNYDLFIGMDDRNISSMLKIFGNDKDNKVKLLLDYSPNSRNVLDPYYTGDFNSTYNDIIEGIKYLYKSLIQS